MFVHDAILRIVFRARDKGVRLNRAKLQWTVNKVKYVGMIVSDQGLSHDFSKIKTITYMRTS